MTRISFNAASLAEVGVIASFEARVLALNEQHARPQLAQVTMEQFVQRRFRECQPRAVTGWRGRLSPA